MASPFSTAAVLALGSLSALLVSCQGSDSASQTAPPAPEVAQAASPPATESMSAATEPVAPDSAPTATSEAPPKPQRSYFRDAVNRASSAVAIGQSAQSPDDWTLAANRWQQAIDLMQQVPTEDPDYSRAQTKVREYQQNLAAVQQRMKRPVAPASSPEPQKREDGLVAQIPVVERRGGTPVVPVSLTGQKGSQQFTMLFDTGATATLITPAMAQAIGVVVVDQATVTIADGSQVTMPIGFVDAVSVGGLTKEAVLVAIGGDVGLLGQNIYGDYGISMGAEVINLYE